MGFPEQATQGLLETRNRYGLQQVVECVDVKRPHGVAVEPSYEHDLRLLGDSAGEFERVAIAQLDVQIDHIGRMPF